LNKNTQLFRRRIVPTLLWAGGLVAFPLLPFVPDSYGLPAFLGCLVSHTFGGCWLLYSLRGRRDLLAPRMLVPLPASLGLAFSLWAMRQDDMQYAGVLISGVVAVILWLTFAWMRLPPPED
jgi:hypothetical protein